MSDLPHGWAETTIGELCDRTNGFVQTGPFGSDLHASDYTDNGTPVIMPSNLGRNRLIEDGIARVGREHVERLRTHQVQTNDIVFPRRGDVARYAVIDSHSQGWLCGTGCLLIRFGDNEVIDSRYLGYWLGTTTVENWLLSNAVGTTMPNLNTSILKALPVPLPPLLSGVGF
ncbi:MAG: restriction endonuclease subunit S [Phototrophicaceae bacterium]